MDRIHFDKKMQDMLDDTDVYRKLKRDPSPALECKMNSMLLQLNRNKEIPDASFVRNFKRFVQLISNQCIEDDEVMVSFDVVSLFTNVPRDLAIAVAARRLESDGTLQDRTNLSVQNILSLLTVCLDVTFLLLPYSFRGHYYQQIKGTAMGWFSSLCNGCEYGDGGYGAACFGYLHFSTSVLEEIRT